MGSSLVLEYILDMFKAHTFPSLSKRLYYDKVSLHIVEGHGSRSPRLTLWYTNYIFLYYKGQTHKTGTKCLISAVLHGNHTERKRDRDRERDRDRDPWVGWQFSPATLNFMH